MGACGFLTASAVCGVLFLFQDQIISAGLENAGFEPEGRTEDIFAEADAANTVPIPQIVDAQAPAQFSISAGNYGQETLPNNAGVTLQVGADESGQQLATVTTTETEIRDLCQQWTTACSSQGFAEDGYTVRNVRIDLKNGGVVVSADVIPEGVSLPQRAGVVMQVSGTQLSVRGVDIGGVTYSTAPPEVQAVVDEAERFANDVVRQLAVNAQGEQYDLESINITEDALTLLLR